MKYKTTAKELREGYYKIISIGYCDLQNLLSYESPVTYSSGIYGWNFDVYDILGAAIVTGYRGMPSKNSKAPYALVRKYELKSQGKTEKQKRKLILKFIAEAIKKEKTS
jgi:hypothetical protein